ncbi:hypothetical protein KC19_VG312000 [Ceratodon purpureus]|nr:hypothetical protein KC19_VG312000 [Ceratodon purpureus]
MEMVRMLVKWVALSASLSSRAWGHFLPLDQCDFYFQGHKETAPMLDVMVTRNLTASPPILTIGDMEVVAAEIGAECAFLPDPSMVFEKRSCTGHFHVRNHHLSGRFASEEFASLEAFRFHQVLLALESAELADGTLLDKNDTNVEYRRPRRCVTFLTTPAIIPHYNSGTGIQRVDIITRIVDLVPKMLNKAHRKKLNKITTSMEQVGRDMGVLAQSVADFP